MSAERDGGCHPSLKTSRGPFPLWESEHFTKAVGGFQKYEGNLAAVSTCSRNKQLQQMNKQSPSSKEKECDIEINKPPKPAPRGEASSWRYEEQGMDEVAKADLVSVGLLRTRDPNDVAMTIKAIK